MKKLFTLFVALCCMAGIAKAEFADGVKIYVDGTEVAAQEQACFTSGKITKGNISYDPNSHILYMAAAQIKGTYANALEIDAPADADFKVTIMLCGNGENNLSTTSSNQWGLYLDCAAELRGYKHELTCKGTRGGIFLSEIASLTINGGVQVTASGAAYGVRGAGTGKYSTLKIENGTLYASNTNTNGSSTDYACVSKVNLVMAGSSSITSPSGAEYKVDKNGSVVKSGNYITNNTVEITPSGDLLCVYPRQPYCVYDDLTGRVGTYVIKKGEDVQLNPCVHAGGDIFNVSFVEGPEAKQWEGAIWDASSNYKVTGSITNAEIEVPATTKSQAVAEAAFYKTLTLNEDMYVLSLEGTEMSANLRKTKDFDYPMDLVAALPSAVNNATNVTYASNGVNGEGYIYFTTEESSKAGVYRIAWEDLLTNKDKATVSPVRSPKNDYYPFTGLSYNWVDGELYGIVKKTSDSKWYLVTIQVGTGGIDVKGALSAVSASNPAIAMACDKYGDIYCLVYKDNEELLYKINPSNGVMTLYSHTGNNITLVNTEVTIDNLYKFHSMQFDYKTNKFLWRGCDKFTHRFLLEFNMPVGHTDIITSLGVGSDGKVSGNMGIFQVLPPNYRITAKTADGNYGTVQVEGRSTVMAFEGSTVTLIATGDATEGTVFKQWKDGNKDNPRTVTVKANATYEAEFWYGEGTAMYPIWINAKQVHAKRLSFTKTELPSNISAGAITYNPSTNTLELNGLTMSNNDATALIRIGEEAKSTKVTIKVVNADSKLTGTLSAVPLRLYNADVTIKGDKKLTLDGAGCGLFIGKGSTVTFEGVTATLKGSYAINGDESSAKEKLIVKGSTVTLDGVTKAAYELNGAEWKYCTPSPSDAFFDKEKKNFTKGEGGSELTDVSFTADKHVKGVTVQDGTGTFQIKLRDGSGDTFTDIGWFESGKELTMIAKPVTGFVFGRWTDDSNWGDETKKDDWLKATREDIKMGALDITKEALFYKQPAAGATWYCISDKTDYFTQFASRSYGDKKVETDKTDASSIEAGDCNSGYYYIAESGDIKRFKFTGVTKDKEIANYSKAEVRATYSGTVTDMAFNYSDNKFYAVMDGDQKLYRLNEASDKKCLDEIGTFVTGDPETKVTITCIAIDGSGKKYVLSSSNVLYVVEKENAKDKKVVLKVVGDEGGKVGGPTVGTSPQSLAFDHVNGELFWGAKDYLRIIDLKTAKSYIAGDLGLTKGNQGYLKGLTRRDRKVSLGVQVAADCLEMGSATIDGGGAELSTFAGTSVTITAKENEGYKFVRWQELLDEGDDREPEIITENPYSFSASSSITYVAYFAASEEGIENIETSAMNAQKVLEEGNLYIIRDGKVYNATGNRVK